MSKYEYQVTETKSIDVPDCPLCGSSDLKFWNYSRDDSMHGAAAGVKCRVCGHEVKVDGNELHMDCGEDCQRAAISKWESQVERFGRHNAEIPPKIEDLQRQLKKIGEENQVLKCVIALEKFCPTISSTDYNDGLIELKSKFVSIMKDFSKQSPLLSVNY